MGEHPRLEELEDDDVKFHTDFRRVYATMLDQWLHWPSKAVFGEAFEPVKALRAKA